MMRASSTSAGSSDLARDEARLVVELLEERRRTSASSVSRVPSSRKYSRPISLPLRMKNTCDAGIAVLARQGDHVGVGPGRGDDLLPLDDVLDRPQPVAQRGPPARKLLPGGWRSSAFACASPPRRSRRRGSGTSRRSSRRYSSWATAPMHGARHSAMSYYRQARCRPGDRPVAGEIGEDPAQRGRASGARADRRVGAEVAAAVAIHLPRDVTLGNGVGPMHLDVRVALVVLEPDVVVRPVALDQVHLEDQRLELRADDDPFEVGDVRARVVRSWGRGPAEAWKYERTRCAG